MSSTHVEYRYTVREESVPGGTVWRWRVYRDGKQVVTGIEAHEDKARQVATLAQVRHSGGRR